MSKHVMALAIALLVGGVFFAWTYNKTHAPEAPDEQPVGSAPTQADVETAVGQYVREHITTLSPEPAVLGGTFYVTDVAYPGEGTAVVSYEDGHIALVADVTYAYTPETGVLVRSFTVRPADAPAKPDVPDSQDAVEAVCVKACGNGICEEVVCMGTGCPCGETRASCAEDCSSNQ
jgi:hypothetical protein